MVVVTFSSEPTAMAMFSVQELDSQDVPGSCSSDHPGLLRSEMVSHMASSGVRLTQQGEQTQAFIVARRRNRYRSNQTNGATGIHTHVARHTPDEERRAEKRKHADHTYLCGTILKT